MTSLLLFFLILLFCLNLNIVASAIGDDQFTFEGFTNTNLSLDGVATITSSGLLMLTNGTYHMKGHAFYPTPLQFRKSPNGTLQSFSTMFVFGIIGEYIDVSGSGMAFFITPSKNLSTTMTDQYLGLFNDHGYDNTSTPFFAVELDTASTNEFHDINSNHVGIDINSLISLNSTAAGYNDDRTNKFRNLSLISHEPMQVWVDYDGHTMELKVTMAPLQVSKPKKPLLYSIVDLTKVVMNEAYVGFSSSTGIFFSRHFVLGWSFSLNGVAPPLDYTKLPKLPLTDPKSRSKVLEIVLPIATAANIIMVATAIFVFMRRRFRYAELREDWEVEFGPHRFSYKDLFHATNGFKDKQLLGIGGFGKVHKGVLPTSKIEVAVKSVSHESRQGMKEFIAEVVTIGRLRHRNLVPLLGYCRRKRELLLVYEYMPNGSLDKYLYDRTKPTLGWSLRFQIIKSVASGLLYLHEDWEQVIIHRDIKASNMLLDSNMNGRLGDFGLARMYDHGSDLHTTHVAGTIGYLAPELGHNGRATRATDVFAFGAFLLEVACGRRPVQQDTTGNQIVVVDWVLEHWREESITDTVDPRLVGDYNVEEAILVLKLGLLCSHPLPGARPGMRRVMQYLDGDMPLPEFSPTNLSFSLLALMQNKGFDERISRHPLSATSIGTMSSLSGGR